MKKHFDEKQFREMLRDMIAEKCFTHDQLELIESYLEQPENSPTVVKTQLTAVDVFKIVATVIELYLRTRQ